MGDLSWPPLNSLEFFIHNCIFIRVQNVSASSGDPSLVSFLNSQAEMGGHGCSASLLCIGTSFLMEGNLLY